MVELDKCGIIVWFKCLYWFKVELFKDVKGKVLFDIGFILE